MPISLENTIIIGDSMIRPLRRKAPHVLSGGGCCFDLLKKDGKVVRELFEPLARYVNKHTGITHIIVHLGTINVLDGNFTSKLLQDFYARLHDTIPSLTFIYSSMLPYWSLSCDSNDDLNEQLDDANRRLLAFGSKNDRTIISHPDFAAVRYNGAMWRDYLHINEEGASLLLETFKTALAGIPTDDDLTGELSDDGTEKPPLSERLPLRRNKRDRSPLRELDGTTAKVAGKSCIFQDCSVSYTTSLCHHFFSFHMPYRIKHDNKNMPFWKEFFRHLMNALGIKKISDLTTFARSCIDTDDLPDQLMANSDVQMVKSFAEQNHLPPPDVYHCREICAATLIHWRVVAYLMSHCSNRRSLERKNLKISKKEFSLSSL